MSTHESERALLKGFDVWRQCLYKQLRYYKAEETRLQECVATATNEELLCFDENEMRLKFSVLKYVKMQWDLNREQLNLHTRIYNTHCIAMESFIQALEIQGLNVIDQTPDFLVRHIQDIDKAIIVKSPPRRHQQGQLSRISKPSKVQSKMKQY